MLDCGQAEESRLRRIVLRHLRGKAEDVLFRSLQPFIVWAYSRLSITKGRRVIRSNPKWLREIRDIRISDNEVGIGIAKGNDKEERRETHQRTRTDMDKDWTQDVVDAGCGNVDPRKRIQDNGRWSKVRQDRRQHTRKGGGYS
jgi:hypothetical protein